MMVALLLGGCSVEASAPGTSSSSTASEEPNRALSPAECAGAAALAEPGCGEITFEAFVPSVDDARSDTSAVYADDCRSDTKTTEVRECVFGAEDGRLVALIGDSHAAIWFPALEPIAERHGWRLQVYYRSACSFSLAPRTVDGGDPEQLQRCLVWNDELQRQLAADEPHELVFTASFSGMRYLDAAGVESRQAAIDGFTEAWTPLTERGTRLVVMAEPPLLGLARLECQLASPIDPLPCSPSPDDARAQLDLAVEAARLLGVDVVDLWNAFCSEDLCPTVLGGVLVYRDEHHFTGTFGTTLAPYLERELVSAGIIDG